MMVAFNVSLYIFLLHKRERFGFFIRTLWALLQNLAVGDVAQRITDVPVYKGENIVILNQGVNNGIFLNIFDTKMYHHKHNIIKLYQTTPYGQNHTIEGSEGVS